MIINTLTSGDHDVFLCSPLYQAFIIEDEEQTRSLPPNPFNDLTEKVLQEYKTMVERKQQGQEGAHCNSSFYIVSGGQTVCQPLKKSLRAHCCSSEAQVNPVWPGIAQAHI